MPEDPHAVLKQTHPAMRILDNSAIVIQRQLEMMNVLMGFEQANRYVIMDPHGNHVGYLAERDHGIGSAVKRQMFKTHRSFTTHVFDRDEKEVLRFHRPFAWINSRIRVYDAVGSNGGSYTSSTELHGTSTASVVNQTSASVSSLDMADMRIIGATEQEWAPLRRKYNLYMARKLADAAPGTPQIAPGNLPLSSSKAMTVAEDDNREVAMLQFARVDERFLSWDFGLMSEDGRQLGSVNRNFGGFAREIFTDTGVYALRMDAAAIAQESAHTGHADPAPGMTLDQRAVMLATAVSVDFDYFSPISGQFWLGTDYLGRDIFSRILVGARYTVGISLAAVVLACASGVVLGMTAAVIGGWLDTVLSRLLDALNSIPSKLFGLVVVAAVIFLAAGGGYSFGI